jgi:hypothetical protein
MAKTCAVVTLDTEINGGCLHATFVYRPRGAPNIRDNSQIGMTITAPSRK